MRVDLKFKQRYTGDVIARQAMADNAEMGLEVKQIHLLLPPYHLCIPNP